MEKVNELFVKMKQWQLSLYFIVIVFFSNYIAQKILFSNSIEQTWLVVLWLLILMYAIGMLLWLSSIGNSLYINFPVLKDMKVSKFRLSLKFLTLYLILTSIMVFSIVFYEEEISVLNGSKIVNLLLNILFILAVFCYFYVIVFVAKALKSIKAKNSANFSEAFLEFLCIFFFPIGVWFIQPRINKL